MTKEDIVNKITTYIKIMCSFLFIEIILFLTVLIILYMFGYKNFSDLNHWFEANSFVVTLFAIGFIIIELVFSIIYYYIPRLKMQLLKRKLYRNYPDMINVGRTGKLTPVAVIIVFGIFFVYFLQNRELCDEIGYYIIFLILCMLCLPLTYMSYQINLIKK